MRCTAKSCYLQVGVLSFVLLAVFVLPAYGQPRSKLDADTKAKVAALIEDLKDEDEEVRRDAAAALGDIGPAAAKNKDAVPALIVALKKDEDEEVRRNAATALGKIGPVAAKNKDAVPALIIALKKDVDEEVRRNAAIALGKFGPAAAKNKDAVPALTEALKDEDEDVREAAEEALKKIKAKK